MVKRVYLSPSDQRRNTYAAGGTTEAIQCGRIAAACKAALERSGVEVMVGQYDTMANRVAESNLFKADLHVPIHTNAANGKATGAVHPQIENVQYIAVADTGSRRQLRQRRRCGMQRTASGDPRQRNGLPQQIVIGLQFLPIKRLYAAVRGCNGKPGARQRGSHGAVRPAPHVEPHRRTGIDGPPPLIYADRWAEIPIDD